MRLLDLFEHKEVHEVALMELRGYTSPGVDTSNATVIAWRGYYWLLPSWQHMNSVPEEVLYNIARTIGMDEYEEGDDGEQFMNIITDVTESRPDIIFGTIQNNELYFRPMGAGGQSPITSTMLKKLVQELGLSGVNTDDMTYHGDENEVYTVPREMKGKLPETLFHGTTSEYMHGIVRTGLRPGVSPSNWKQQGIEHNDLIFGAVTLDTATFHANKTAGVPLDPYDGGILEPDDPFPVIIEFKIPDPNLVVPDYDVASEVIGQTNQTDQLGYTAKPNYARFTNADEITKHNPEGRLWKSARVFGYKGRIPPSHIVRVYADFYSAEPIQDPEWNGTLPQFFQEWDDRYKDYKGDWEDEDEDY